MKKSINIILAVACLGIFPLHVLSAEMPQEHQIVLMDSYPITDEVSEEILQEQPALEAYYNILDSFDQKFGVGNYPDSYAGAYITDEKQLCVLLTADTPETRLYYKQCSGNENILIFDNALYSYKELESAYEEITHNDTLNIRSMSIDVVDNCISIGVGPEHTSLTTHANEESIYKFVYEPEGIGESTDIYGGTGVVGYTIGSCGSFNGEEAVVLCGHGISEGDVLTLQSTVKVIADVVLQQCAMDENYDYAVAEIRPAADVVMTNKVHNNVGYSSITSQARRIPAVGSTVCMYGKNEGFGVGKVTATTSSLNMGNYNIVCYGLVKCRWDEGREAYGAGNSGGPIYSTHTFYGTYSGSNAEGGDFWFSPINVVPNFSVKTS